MRCPELSERFHECIASAVVELYGEMLEQRIVPKSLGWKEAKVA